MQIRRGTRCIVAVLLAAVVLLGGCRSDDNGRSSDHSESSPSPYGPRSRPFPIDPNDRSDGNDAIVGAKTYPPLPEGTQARLLEVQEKVHRAAEYLSEHGQRVLGEFDDPNSRWGRSPYVFVWTIHGVCLAHPINTSLVGKNLMGLTDTHGNNFAVEFARIAASESRGYQGWCDYWWTRYGKEKSEHKVSFIQRVPGRTWLVGAGLYIDDISAKQVEYHLADPNAGSRP